MNETRLSALKLGKYCQLIKLKFQHQKSSSHFLHTHSVQTIKTQLQIDHQAISGNKWPNEPINMEKHQRNLSSGQSENEVLSQIADHDSRTVVRPLSGFHLLIVLFM